MTEDTTASKLAELAKRRGFFFQSSGAYGGVAGFYTFGPEGATIKRNVEEAWRDRFAVKEGHMEVDAPTIMPEAVFEASGHLETFDDMLVECAECGESHRADHLIEDTTAIEDAEALPIEEVEQLLCEHGISCPACGAALADRPVDDFNLMFATNIGPGDSSPGYLRPETAQGIFVEFPRLKEYARGQLPFGVTQIGRAYRNEISPRKSVIRTREFTQAELELFVDPEEDEPDLASVADVDLRLYPVPEQQDEDGEVVETTVEAAAETGIVDSEWIAYYLGVAQQWYERVGVDPDRFRFRQHLPGERSHYASDCWDAESAVDGVLRDDEAGDRRPTGGDWIELAGFAYRGDYDLSKHDEYSEDDYTVFKQYDEPRVVERATVDPDMSELGPEFGGAAADIATELERLAERNRAAFEGDVVEVEVDEKTYEVPVDLTGFAVEEQKESGRHLSPHVIEPSFGVDRLVYTVLEHNYREDEVDGETRTYLKLDPEVAPTTVAVFPLMDRNGMGERAREIERRLRDAGLETSYDDAGAIGRRYRRQDEVGTPYCVTVDHDTLADDTVTVRDRDTTEQIRVAVGELPQLLRDLRDGRRTFDELDGEPVDG